MDDLTLQEFDQWVEYHRVAFSGIANAAKPGNIVDATYRKRWYDTLRRFSQEELVQATDALHAGEVIVYGLEGHPAAIAQWIRDKRIKEYRRNDVPPRQPHYSTINERLGKSGTATYEEIVRRCRKKFGDSTDWKARRKFVLSIIPQVMDGHGW